MDDSVSSLPIPLTGIEAQLHQFHGGYGYLCFVNGETVWTHHPIGRVLKEFADDVG